MKGYEPHQGVVAVRSVSVNLRAVLLPCSTLHSERRKSSVIKLDNKTRLSLGTASRQLPHTASRMRGRSGRLAPSSNADD
eukprot:1731130-Pyramimonas_sp.AAC.1